MKVIDDIAAIPRLKNAVITIGSFDGVHYAHQQIFHKLHQLADEIDGTSVVITFEPHPRKVIYPEDEGIRLLTTKSEKSEQIARFGIDYLIFVPFTLEFSQIPPKEYIETFILQTFQPAIIVLGYDHQFGLNRSGDIHLLETYSESGNFKLHQISKKEINHITISSTQIRQALETGDIDKANQLLGRPYSLSGVVIRGMKIGNTLGYPTANISVPDEDKLIPGQGIYAIHVQHEGQMYDGMLYIGNRPTIEDDNALSIEINIFEFAEEIYGHTLEIHFLHFIRADQKFDDLGQLKQAIQQDHQSVKSFFKKLGEPNQYKHRSAVVILNYNGLNYFKKFLVEIIRALAPFHHLVIADNASTDASVEYVRTNFPQIELIPISKNLGFAGGYNEALKKVSAEYYVLLNSDILVDNDWASPIIAHMEKDASIGAAQPKIRAYDNRIMLEYAGAAGGWIDVLGYPFCRGRILESTEEDEGRYNDDQECFWATGAAMVIRSRLFHDIGRFDDWYFAHQEEIDLCWRLKRAGYKVMVYPQNAIYHVGGGTLSYQSTQKTFLNFRNSLASLIKNESKRTVLLKVLLRFILDGVAGMYFLVKGEYKQTLAVVKAHFSLYGKLGYLLKKRYGYAKAIKKNRIGPSTVQIGRYPRSIIWQYYIKGINQFHKLPFKK